MTREEAVKVLESSLLHNSESSFWANKWLDAFEKLGMLKLQQSQEDIAKNELLAHLSTSYSLCLSRDIIDFMTKGGFKVVKAK